jgi:hypothetical protein
MMSCETITITWAGIEYPSGGFDAALPADDESVSIGHRFDDRLACATDPFDDFDDDDFDDEFDDDFEEEWDEELPGDADQFEEDDAAEKEGGLTVEPDFEDED